jgi:CDP-diacylglycerol--glycerol-3-phosphate 3-phosphatidyltransferase
LGIFLFAASTDVFDGFIARRYNQVTDLGKFLDPFADKVMHVGVILSLVIIGYVHWLFVLLLVIKELAMIIGGIFLINHKVVIQANSMGKVASAIISIGVIVSFFHPYVYMVDWAILGIGLVATYVAFVNYGTDALRDFKRIKEEKRLKELDEEDKKEDNEGEN